MPDTCVPFIGIIESCIAATKAPGIDNSVNVNIRPFQEAGLLAGREVIKQW